MSLDLQSEKAQFNYDLEPGELPDQRSPFDLRVMGMEISIRIDVMLIFFAF